MNLNDFIFGLIYGVILFILCDKTFTNHFRINNLEYKNKQLEKDIEYLKKLESGYKPKDSDFVEEDV